MSTISIVYFSQSGSTEILARAIARGAARVEGTQTKLLPIMGKQIVEGRWNDPATIATLNDSDAIVFGAPTYMGGVAAQFKTFADATGGIWYNRGWKDKVAGGFTVSGSPSGDKSSTIGYLTVLAAQHGMAWVGPAELPSRLYPEGQGANRLGSFQGLIADNPAAQGQAPEIHPDHIRGAELYGERIAEFAQRLVHAAVAA